MADIAMLVAEEYERRVKKSSDEEIFFFSAATVSVLADRMKESMGKIVNYNTNFKVVHEPKTQIVVAAIDGLFSA